MKVKKECLFLLMFIGSNYFCQTISPAVINSAGKSYSVNVSGVYVSDNVGEPFTQTLNGPNQIITQGFLQPLTTAVASVSVIKNDVSCQDKKDGNISVSVSNLFPNSQVNYIWTPTISCNCNKNDSLAPGTYSLMILITHSTTGGFKTDTLKPAPTLINDANGPCRVKIYTVITPNGDGNNDILQIDNISDFPNNHVAVFNRWGNQIFETKHYDNISNFWPQKEEISNLASSTYFYVVKLGDGTNPLKGWIEIIKN